MMKQLQSMKLFGSRNKQYDSKRWQEKMSVDTLQGAYDQLGWAGHGECRQRNVDALARTIQEIYETVKGPVKVLDVACFSGDYLGKLLEIPGLTAKFHYTGVDVTPAYVSHAANRWKAIPNADFLCGSALNLPRKDNSADIVFNSGMLIHIDNVGQCIREFARVSSSRLLMETTINHALTTDFIEEGKSGPDFIDRVYRRSYIEGILSSVANIVRVTETTYRKHISVLFETVSK